MSQQKRDFAALAETSRNNLLKIFGMKLMENNDRILHPVSDTLEASLQEITDQGFDYFYLLEMLQNTSLDRWAVTQLLETVLDFLDILSYDRPLKVAVKFFFNRILQAYAIAVTYSSGEGNAIFYRFFSTLNENSTRITQEALVDDSYYEKADEMADSKKKKKEKK
ncbi:hypothetical protein [Candidatus Lokiarchaeum ossiferum]|uniref:hypothetical protein n=1 Tax=Candidatus Lokiarchaeum ossiferum TaxID=2951803 RepID=UPI00352BE793